MIRIIKEDSGSYVIGITDDEKEHLLVGCYKSIYIEEAWHSITLMMYQFNSNACLVCDESNAQHVIYRLYEDGTKEELPIKVRNPESITVSKSK